MPQFDIINRILIHNPYSNLDALYGPYASTIVACNAILPALRERGLTVGVDDGSGVNEWWWKNGTNDSDLVKKNGQGASLDVSNPLYQSGNTIFIYQATSGQSGYITYNDYNLFYNKQNALPSTPLNPTQMYLNGNLQWSTISVGNGGYAANLYNSSSASTIVNGYSQLSYMPDSVETQYTNTITNQEVLFRTYLYESTINTNIIDAGLWTGSFTAKVSNAVGVTQLKFEPFLRHTDGTETTLFSVYSPEIDNTDFVTIKLESSQGLFNIVTTDRFGLRVYGKTTSGAAITITTIVGDGRGGYIVVPVRLRHNQLRDLNGDTNYLHSTQTQQSNWDNAYSNRIISLTTTGSSGTATLLSNILNIPTYTINGLGGIPTTHTVYNITNGSGLLKNNGSGTWSYDNNTYLTNNQTINLSGEASGSGNTSIAVTLANSSVIGKVLSGYTATSGTITSSDSILQAIQKIGYDKHVAVTIGTANGLSLSTQALSLGLASASSTGALSYTDWNTFNGKQSILSGTGIVKSTSGTISYLTDNSSNWDNAYTHSTTTTGTIHGSTTVGGNFFRLTNPSTITFPRINADNSVSTLSASDFRTAIGAGTVTSVGLSTPTGLSISGSPITSSGTLALSLTSGYVIPTTTEETNWNSAYTFTNGYSTNYPDLTAIENLSGTSGLLRKTASNTWSLDTSTYLTGITSTQVTDALGYTPYNSSNPNGYITSSALSGYATTSWVGSNYTAPYHTGSDFADGTLVVTNIDATLSSGDSFVLEATGKSYQQDVPPFNFMIQGYIYNNTFISYSGLHLSGYGFSEAKILSYNGYLAFWWPRVSYWNSFQVSVRSADGTIFNRVTSIINSTEPSSSKKVTVSMKLGLNTYNYSSYCAKPDGSNASGTWGINISGTAANANYLNNVFGNETIIHNGYNSSGSAWINYRGAVSAITNYSFANGLNTGTLAQITASQFNGSGTGLTGTASNLHIGGTSLGTRRTHLGMPGSIGALKSALITQMNSDGGNIGSAICFNGYLDGIMANWTNDSYTFGSSSDATLFRLDNYGTSTYGTWLAVSYRNNDIYQIGRDGGNWTSIYKLLTTGNISSYALVQDTWIGSKYFGSNGAIYGTIFYDTNNTSYYIDPGANSVLNTLTISGGSPSAGKVLTATDTSGNCTWQSAATTTSGTYTPTVTATNCTVTLNTCTYMKVGTIVHVKICGTVSYGTANCSMAVSLPYTSSTVPDYDAGAFILGTIGANYFSNANGFITRVGISSSNLAYNQVAFEFDNASSGEFVMQFDYVTS